jgi:hypothetical protein
MKISNNVSTIQEVMEAIDIDRFYNLAIRTHEITMQGQYDNSLVMNLRKAGFQGFTIDNYGFANCDRLFGDVIVKITLT